MTEHATEPLVAHLSIDTAGQVPTYRLDLDDGQPAPTFDGSVEALAAARALAAELDSTFFAPSTTDTAVASVAAAFLDSAVPTEVVAMLQKWNGQSVESTLLISSDQGSINDLPWELLPSALGGGLFVVRLTGTATATAPGVADPSMVMAGWSLLPGGVPLSGVVTEMTEIPAELNESISTEPLHAPTIDELRVMTTERNPAIVHLAAANGLGGSEPAPPGAGNDHATGTFLRLDPIDPAPSKLQKSGYGLPQYHQVLDAELLDIVAASEKLALVVLNTMPNPPTSDSSLPRLVGHRLGSAVFAWNGAIQDSIAVDFTRFLYHRLLEGEPLPTAVRAFTRQFSTSQWIAGALPTVWIPSRQWLDDAVLAGPSVEPADRLDEGPVTRRAPVRRVPQTGATASDPPDITIDFRPHESLFPALLINGSAAVRSLSLTSDQECSARLELACDTGAGESTFSSFRSLVVGSNSIDVRDIGFPALYEMLDTNEPRIVNFRVSVAVDGRLLAQTTRSVRWRSNREWLDSDDSHPFVPAFVLPMSRGVSELIRRAESILAQIAGPQQSFSGYPRKEEGRAEATDRQVQALYQALRNWGLKYITPPGTPVYVPDPSLSPETPLGSEESTKLADRTEMAGAAGQLVRLPDDIVERGHGTCHDLSLFLAAAIEYINLRAIVALLPGHTLVGYWRNPDLHDAYWSTRSEPSNTGFGSSWQLSGPELAQLVESQQVVLVETTLCTNPVATFDQATSRGRQFIQRGLQVGVDVRRSRKMIQPLSLG